MPHDKNGTVLAVGDIVTVECIVTSIQPSEDYCNCNLESVDVMPPYNTKSTFVVNTKQVTKK